VTPWAPHNGFEDRAPHRQSLASSAIVTCRKKLLGPIGDHYFMRRWEHLPHDHLLADVSLWSANLAELKPDIEKVMPYVDSFHIDVADSRFVPSLLFFPDLVAAIRPLTRLPFHIHLVVERPSQLLPDFCQAGGDFFSVHVETGDAEVRACFKLCRELERDVGLALRLETPIEAVRPYLHNVSSILLLGTEAGIKGADLDSHALLRIREVADVLKKSGRRQDVRIIADGAIRKNTVPSLRTAGTDVIVPGSLVFAASDLASTFGWIKAM
jgi:ribulose-phosphate 3-epimerase